MHRTFRGSWVLVGGLFALLGAIPPLAPAQICTPEIKPIIVLVNSAVRVQMTSRKPIKSVLNPKEGLLTIRTVERDPTMIILVGLAPGITKLDLEDVDGIKETREIMVQADLEYLTRQLRCAVPNSNIALVPIGDRTISLTGFIFRAEDAALAQAIVQAAGYQSINGLRLNGVPQVQLDVVLARVRRTKGREFGFNFIGNGRQTIFGSKPGGIIPIDGSVVGVPSTTLQPTQFGQFLNTAPGANSTLFGGIIGNAGGFLGFLQALEREGLAKLLAQPRLVTLSGNPASFLDGGQQAVPQPGGLGTISVQFEPFGTSLNFLPVVLGNGRIHLEVEPEVSILDAAAGTVIGGTAVPGRTTQRIHTTVEMESGQTFVIGGLIQKEVRASANKVPVLGQVPFLGAAFSQKTYDEIETELVVMVTPHLVDAQSACQVTKVLPGQESRTPDDFELFLEGILEAPRGPREIWHGNRYVPAHLNGPTANLFPCAGRADGLHGQPIAGSGGIYPGASCGSGGCTTPSSFRMPTPLAGPATQAVPSQAMTAPVATPLPGSVPAPVPAQAPPAMMPPSSPMPVTPAPAPTPLPGAEVPPPQPAMPSLPLPSTLPVSATSTRLPTPRGGSLMAETPATSDAIRTPPLPVRQPQNGVPLPMPPVGG